LGTGGASSASHTTSNQSDGTTVAEDAAMTCSARDAAASSTNVLTDSWTSSAACRMRRPRSSSARSSMRAVLAAMSASCTVHVRWWAVDVHRADVREEPSLDSADEPRPCRPRPVLGPQPASSMVAGGVDLRPRARRRVLDPCDQRENVWTDPGMRIRLGSTIHLVCQVGPGAAVGDLQLEAAAPGFSVSPVVVVGNVVGRLLESGT
jgi:hypothetical protein